MTALASNASVAAPAPTRSVDSREAGATNLGLRLVRRDSSVMHELYSAYRPLVLSYVRRSLAHEDAEEVTQTTFYEVWRSAERYDPNRSLRGWILGIAKKRTIDYLRRRKGETVSLDQVPSVPAEDANEREEQIVRAQVVASAMEQLSEKHREVLHLAYFEDLTQVEIAARLDVPLGTVKARAFRGLRQLHGELDRLGWT